MSGTHEVKAWQWEEGRWRGIVEHVRAGRSLKPKTWPAGARVAVALSFDSDHETGELCEAGTSPRELSQGEYGSRVGIPRILDLLGRHGVKASFFVPAVSALLHPEEQRRIVAQGHEIGMHGWIHERNSQLTARDERELQRRA
ncbi:polysaccharide deacetylase family protein [Bradyrhizobium tunisiense]|uniref:polysaccharide deacetylase family protein n=1 Tax=Bradyrhizobium tunisiense TaxID=3278709 RepID=UPI0035DA6C20